MEPRIQYAKTSAPWADGTIGGALAVNGDQGRMHWSWLREGLRASKQE